MIDIELIREHPELVKAGLQKRDMEGGVVDEAQALDIRRRELLVEVEALKAERNAASKQIGAAKDDTEREKKIAAMRTVGDQIDALDAELGQVDQDLNNLMAVIPNLPFDEVPAGGEENNVVVKEVGDKPQFGFEAIPHWDLGPQLGIINFEQGVKVTGSRFYVLSGPGARLQRALIAWMLDLHIRQGYTEKYTPFMVKEAVLFGAGQLPKFADNLYRDHEEDLWMVPTAEVPLTGLHMDDVLEEASLPRHYTAYTPCFRREKMSAGRDVRGIKRGHQFDKVEMYKFCRPEDSEAEFERMVADAEQTCAELGFTYRVNRLSTGDLGFTAHITADIEVWAPGCGEWLEVSSVSNVGEFQARRANIKYRPADGGRLRFVHTLNGSGLGLPRTLIAVLENYQQEDGSVVIPEVLRPWMGGIDALRPEA
jgi:seryl-tRNA synthetase